MAARAADGLDGFLTEVGDRIAQAEVAGFDETGLRVAGKLHWVHCARTGKYTLITCHPKRGTKGIDAAGGRARRGDPGSADAVSARVPGPAVRHRRAVGASGRAGPCAACATASPRGLRAWVAQHQSAGPE